MAMLTPDIQHSFTVPVDIPCRNNAPKPSAIVESPPVDRFCAYSAQNVPRRFDCFVKLERLSQTKYLDDIRVEPEERMDTGEVKPEPMPATGSAPQQSCENEEDPMDLTEPTEAVKAEYHNEATQSDVGDVLSQETSSISTDISRSRTISTETSFDIKVENSMRLTVMETPPPDVSPPPSLPMVNVPTSNLSLPLISTTITKCHKRNKVVSQLPQRLPKGAHDSNRPPTPVEDPPSIPAQQPPAPPPVRPIIKLRNINELLDNPQPMVRLQQMVNVGCATQQQLYHQQQIPAQQPTQQPLQQQPVNYGSPAYYQVQVPNTQRVPTISTPAFSPHSAYASYPSPLYPVLHQPEAQSHYQPQCMAPAAQQQPQQQQYQRILNQPHFMHHQQLNMQTVQTHNTFNLSSSPMPNPQTEGGLGIQGPWSYVVSASNLFSI